MFEVGGSYEPDKPTWLRDLVAMKENTARYATFQGNLGTPVPFDLFTDLRCFLWQRKRRCIPSNVVRKWPRGRCMDLLHKREIHIGTMPFGLSQYVLPLLGLDRRSRDDI